MSKVAVENVISSGNYDFVYIFPARENVFIQPCTPMILFCVRIASTSQYLTTILYDLWSIGDPRGEKIVEIYRVVTLFSLIPEREIAHGNVGKFRLCLL